MSNALCNQLIDEFKSALFDFEAFNKQNSRKIVENDSAIIIFKNKLHFLKNALNAFDFNQENIDNNDVNNVYIDSIPRFIDLLNSFPQHGVYSDLWYELKSYLNIILINLTNNPGENDIWRFTSSANIVAHILTTMEKIPDVPLRVNPQHPDYREKNRIALNVLSTTEKIYFSALCTLYTIPIKEFTHWASMAFWHQNLIEKLLSTLNFPTDTKFFATNVENFYRTLFFNISYNFSSFHLTFNLLGIGESTSVLTQIQTSNVISTISISGILENLTKVSKFISQTINYLNDLLKQGIINRNDDPIKSSWIGLIRSMLITSDFFKEFLSFFEGKLLALNIDEVKPAALELIEKLLSVQDDIKLSLPSRTHDPIYIQVYKLVVALVGFIAIRTSDKEFFEKELQRLVVLRNGLEIREFPEIYFFELLTKIWIDSIIGTSEDIVNHLPHLLTLRDHLKTRSRDYIATTLLLSIITVLNNSEESQEKSLNFLNDIRDILESDGNVSHLKDQIYNHLDFLTNLITKKELKVSHIRPLQMINIMDPLTWVIPEFARFFCSSNVSDSIYLPFNRNIDGIITNYGSLNK